MNQCQSCTILARYDRLNAAGFCSWCVSRGHDKQPRIEHEVVSQRPVMLHEIDSFKAPPTVTQAQAFRALVEYGSPSKAAQHLRQTAAAICASLERLENRLGYQLYYRPEPAERRAHNVRLTAAGERLLEELETLIMERTCNECGYTARGSRNIYEGLCPHCRKIAKRTADRLEAVEWANAVLGRNVLILDTETTNLNGEIIELAMINQNGETVYNSRFRPLGKVSDEAAYIHGLTNEILENEPCWSNEWPKIEALIKAADGVIIYNSSFDVSRIRYTCKLYGVEMSYFNHTCAMEQYSAYVGDWSSYHKSYKWQRLPGGDHTALGDCRATLDVVKRMAAQTAEYMEY